ncbi:hypothetical protein CFAM422_011381 [Trichoderma lentiforme]|uniref:Uncharacterized protein n=1 Tax=Trichoderma lentiforme TaxID=1567552 RepID=A0A9P5C7E1_9HYPO|nr:hypothetical protein CFAM422_011381 [Trichoderma lentiforme]
MARTVFGPTIKRFQRPTAATKKLWAPDPLLARAHRSGKASCHSSMPIHCTVVQSCPSPALTKLDTNKGPPAPARATRKRFTVGSVHVPSVLVTGSAAFPNQPSGERMHESSGGLLQAGWNAQLREERERREYPYRGLGIDTETLPSGFLGLNEQANRRWQGRPQLTQTLRSVQTCSCEIDVCGSIGPLGVLMSISSRQRTVKTGVY